MGRGNNVRNTNSLAQHGREVVTVLVDCPREPSVRLSVVIPPKGSNRNSRIPREKLIHVIAPASDDALACVPIGNGV